jgi:hypothetical protein
VNLRTRFQHLDLTFAAPLTELETKPALPTEVRRVFVVLVRRV